MKQLKFFFMLALLLTAVVQGARADDGWSSASSYDKYSDADKPTHYDTYGGRSDVHVIKTAANYLYVMDKPADYCNKNIYLDINVDVSSKTWVNLDDILGEHRYLEGSGSGYSGTFYGNGHTIRINLDYASYGSYKGPFGIIDEGGKVQDLNVEGTIYLKKMDDGNGTDLVGGICGENNGTIENCSVSASVSSEKNYLGGITGRNTGTISNCRVSGNVSSNSRLVGGIAGENNGTISNCWVSGNVSSSWQESGSAYTAKVGGIAGENNGTLEYCCMTGNVTNNDADVGGIVGDNSGHTISHCTFYGTRSSTHDQKNIYAGDSGTEDYCYGLYNSSEYDAASGKDLYRQAIRYTYAVNVTTVGPGTIRTWAAGEYDVPGTYPDATFTLHVTSGSVASYTITDADGSNIDLQGHANDWSSFWFVMPNKDVNVNVVFYENWPTQGTGTEDDPYLISSADDWNKFAHNVTYGRNYSGQYVKLTADISVSTMAGGYTSDDDYHPFSGTFDGDGHTLTINVSNQSRFAAPFKCVKDATIKNLRTAGTINGTGNSDGKLLAGLAGISFSSATITNCRSSVTLTTNFGEDAAMAGIVAGTKGGSLTIEGCVFDGTMTGSTNTRCAGIAGYEYIATTTVISNTLFAPTTLTVSTADDGYTKTISRDADATITNCYYTEALGTAQGTLATATTTTVSGTPTTDYGMVKAYANGLYFDGKFYGTIASISLADGDDLSALSAYTGEACDVTYTRSFTSGKASTVCLPFAYAPKTGETFYTFTGITESGGEYIADMTEYTGANLLANTPYLFMPTGDADFSGTYAIPATLTAGTTTSGDWTFVGTYTTVSWTEAPTGIYGFSAQNVGENISQGEFVKVGAYVRVKPMRCYLKYKNGGEDYAGARMMNRAAAADEQLPETISVRLISANGDVTAIGTLHTQTGEVVLDGWYTLDGTRLNGQPTRKGIYVNNGKKVIIK